MLETLIENRWYWVRFRASDTYVDPFGDGPCGDWFPAMYSPRAAGGWTNGDCWEDFDREVIEWRLIPLPE
jgi:hypothetical protein